MIYALTIISYDNSLLKHFVSYYKSIGVESFIVAIDERVPNIWSSTEAIASTLSADIRLVPVSERQKLTGVESNNKEEMREKYVLPEDWVIPADLDEFIQFPVPLPQVIREMKRCNATFINGRFSDRLSHTGKLVPTTPETSIWQQYPLEARVSFGLVKCWCTKVTLARGDCILTSGHHNVLFPCKPLVTRKCVIHHFKWRAGLPEALERRREIYGQAGLDCEEATRILDYINVKGRIVPEEFNVKPGWNPSVTPSKKTKVIYTAITDRYDTLKEPSSELLNELECVAFTNCESTSKIWQIEKAESSFFDPCRNAKIHKILPHIYFPDAEYSLWVDGSIVLKPGFSIERMISTYLESHDLAVFRHSKRKCIYEEAEACIISRKDDPDIIRCQMERYRYESYPYKGGLAECSIIFRRHTDAVRILNEAWWEEIKNHSRRDQLSFNYVVWKTRLKYYNIPGSIQSNDMFELTRHAIPSISRNIPALAANVKQQMNPRAM
jgi:hypothetical protein